MKTHLSKRTLLLGGLFCSILGFGFLAQEANAESKNDSSTLKVEEKLGCDFSNYGKYVFNQKLTQQLIDETGQGCQLAGENLKSINFKGADLRKANLTGSDLERANFYNVRLEGANLSYATIFGASFSESALEADFTKAKYDKHTISPKGLNIGKAEGEFFTRVAKKKALADVEQCDYRNYEKYIMNKDATDNLVKKTGRGCQLMGMDFGMLEWPSAYLYKANLRRALFDEADLTGANFEGALVDHASFFKANLQGANLKWNAQLGVDLRYAKLEGAQIPKISSRDSLERATINNLTVLPTPFDQEAAGLKDTTTTLDKVFSWF